MKYLVMLFFISSLYQTINAQYYKENFKADICNCFERKIEADAKALKNAYKICFEESLVDYAELIDAEIEEDNPSIKYSKGQKARTELKRQLKKELIYSCNAFYNSLENERQRILARGRAITYESDIEKLDKHIAQYPTVENYFQRGIKYFMLKNYTEAEKDLNMAIEINPYTERGIYAKRDNMMLAWVLEEQGKFNAALDILNRIKENVYDIELSLIKAVVHRKAGGTAPKMAKPSTEHTKAKHNKKNIIKTINKRTERKKKDTSAMRRLFKIDQ